MFKISIFEALHHLPGPLFCQIRIERNESFKAFRAACGAGHRVRMALLAEHIVAKPGMGGMDFQEYFFRNMWGPETKLLLLFYYFFSDVFWNWVLNIIFVNGLDLIWIYLQYFFGLINQATSDFGLLESYLDAHILYIK